MGKIRIVVADHQYLVRTGLKFILSRNKQVEIVGEAANSAELLNEVEEKTPDIIVIDYNEKSSFSVEDIEVISKRYPSSRFVVITDDENRQTINETLSFGVNGFLTKTCDKEEIWNAIIASAKGEKFYCNKILDILLAKHFGEEDNCSPTELTVREIEIVKLVGMGFPSKKIASHLNLSLHTINTHRKNVMRKLKFKSVSELVLYAINTGIVESSGK